jgi:hypothetical protein
VTYSGTLASTVRLYATVSGALRAHLDVTVEQGTGGSSGSCVGFTGQVIFSGTLAELGLSAAGFTSGVGTFAPSTPGQEATYRISYTLRADTPDSAQGAGANASFIWEARSASGGTGALSGYVTATPATVDLTASGVLDWAHWGRTAKYAYNRKSGVPSLIPTWSELGSPPTVWYYADPAVGFSWTDGTPTATSGGSTTYRVYAGGLSGNGFRLSLPVSTQPRTLRLYVGVYQASGTLTATLSDGATPFSGTTLNSTTGSADGVYTLTYQSPTPGATLRVDWTLTQPHGAAQVNLQAATVH